FEGFAAPPSAGGGVVPRSGLRSASKGRRPFFWRQLRPASHAVKRSLNITMRDSTGLTRGVRSNALWGSGSRGESRKNALWGSGGRGGRRLAMASLAALTLVVPLSAVADNGGGQGKGTFIIP